MATYKNPWHSKSDNRYGPALYKTDAKLTEYCGFLIYERIQGKCWDVVLDGKCVTQRAGIGGARAFIDQQLYSLTTGVAA